MKDIYDYENNIKFMTTPSGDKVITMNKEIFTMICNRLWESVECERKEQLYNTAEDTMRLWKVFNKEYFKK